MATALVMPRTWKAALAPCLAGIPQRTGFVGEGRFGLINDLRWGERRLPRMVERCAALALPKAIPAGRVAVAAIGGRRAEVAAWRQRLGLARDQRRADRVRARRGRPRPSAGRRASYARSRAAAWSPRGIAVWVVGGPGESNARGRDRRRARPQPCGT